MLIPTFAGAKEIQYVSDQLEATLRKGKTNQHQIVRMLRSGAPLEILDVDEKDGYTRVRTADNAEGWILTRYLQKTPVARMQLPELEKQIAAFREENNRLKAELQNSGQQKASLDQTQKKLANENSSLKQELTAIKQTASNALAIDSENKQLKERLFALERDAQIQQQENAALRDRRDRDWFITGATVIVAGIIIGLIVPRLKFKRKTRWDSL